MKTKFVAGDYRFAVVVEDKNIRAEDKHYRLIRKCKTRKECESILQMLVHFIESTGRSVKYYEWARIDS